MFDNNFFDKIESDVAQEAKVNSIVTDEVEKEIVEDRIEPKIEVVVDEVEIEIEDTNNDTPTAYQFLMEELSEKGIYTPVQDKEYDFTENGLAELTNDTVELRLQEVVSSAPA